MEERQIAFSPPDITDLEIADSAYFITIICFFFAEKRMDHHRSENEII